MAVSPPSGRSLNNWPFAHLHLHTDFSWLDGVGRSTEYAEIVSRAGHTHLAITDHGGLHGLPEHRRACLKYGLTPVYGCELYICESRDSIPSSPPSDADLSKFERALGLSLRDSGNGLRGSAGGGERVASFDPAAGRDAHLVVLAQTQVGWSNLLRLNHLGVRHGFHRHPRVTLDDVLDHSEGLIVTTACVSSPFGRLAARGDIRGLRALLARFRDALGDRFVCEWHISSLDLQRRVNSVLIPAARDLGIPIVYASDVHYACACDVARQDEMIAVSRRVPVADPSAFKLEVRSLYCMTAAEIIDHARALSEPFDREILIAAMARAAELAATCNADIYPRGGEPLPPVYLDRNGTPCADPDTVLARLARAGLARRLTEYPRLDRRAYSDRLEHELSIIRACGMAAFYLVSLDIVAECRRRRVMVWTRGSGCASLVAAVIGLTPIDPLRFGLLFERFVDPSRPGAPDFDLDIASDRRDEIAAWFAHKYGGPGGECVARLGAVHTFGLKSAVRDVLFARGAEPGAAHVLAEVADRLSPDIESTLSDSTPSSRSADVEAAVEAMIAECRSGREREYVERYSADLRAAAVFVGRARGKGTHAAGYVVSPTPLSQHIPIDRGVGGKSAEIVTAWSEGQASQDISPAGLLKVDLLALEAASVLGELYPDGIDGWDIDPTDPLALWSLHSGDGAGLHQLADTDNRLAREVQRAAPRSIDDFVAMISLYRPGSIKYLDRFIARLRGREAVPRIHPLIDAVLAETYGVIVYQEQVMTILHRVAGIPLREAYGVIKAISKKQRDRIAAVRDAFVSGAVVRGLGVDVARSIFDQIEMFAGYAFNKAHAASYAVLGWMTARARAERPAEFYRAVLARTENVPARGKSERKIAVLMRSAESSGVKILRPEVGIDGSSADWVIINGNGLPDSSGASIRAPISLIIGIGDSVARLVAGCVLEHVPKPERLSAFFTFIVENRKCITRPVLTALAHGGALARMTAWATGSVRGAWEVSVGLVEWLTSSRQVRSAVEVQHMIREFLASPTHKARVAYVPDLATRMAWEVRAYGWNHWLDPWRVGRVTERVAALESSGRLCPLTARGPGRRAALIVGIRTHRDKRGRPMIFVDLRGRDGCVYRGVVFASVIERCRPLLRPGRVVVLSGRVEHDGSVLIDAVEPFTRSPAFKV
jgi:DNA polymerase-3 subunit alpha